MAERIGNGNEEGNPEAESHLDSSPITDTDVERRTTLIELFEEITTRDGNVTDLMPSRERTELRGRHTSVNIPILDDQDEPTGRLLTQDFTILAGTTVMWDGVPTAIAYGMVETSEGSTPLLIGAAHYPETLADNNVDPKKVERFGAMIGEFPRGFMHDVDYLAFTAGFDRRGNLRFDTGDHEVFGQNVSRISLIDAKGTRSPSIRQEGFREIRKALGEAITQKFAPPTEQPH